VETSRVVVAAISETKRNIKRNKKTTKKRLQPPISFPRLRGRKEGGGVTPLFLGTRYGLPEKNPRLR